MFNTKAEVRAFTAELEEELRDFAARHNVVLEVKGSRYTPGSSITPKLVFAAISSDGTALTPEAQTYKAMARYDEQLEIGWLNTQYETREGVIEVTGYNTRRRKYPVSYTKNGRSMKAPVSYIAAILQNAKPVS